MGARVEAIRDVYARRYPAFRNALAGVTGSYESAHDVVQESFARALARRSSFRGDGPLEAWIWTIAVRVALEVRGQPIEESLAAASDGGLPEPERDWQLDSALRSLPPRRRLIIFLRYVADLPYAQIAQVCGISEGAVAATLAQAKGELAGLLASAEPIEESLQEVGE